MAVDVLQHALTLAARSIGAANLLTTICVPWQVGCDFSFPRVRLESTPNTEGIFLMLLRSIFCGLHCHHHHHMAGGVMTEVCVG